MVIIGGKQEVKAVGELKLQLPADGPRLCIIYTMAGHEIAPIPVSVIDLKREPPAYYVGDWTTDSTFLDELRIISASLTVIALEDAGRIIRDDVD